MFRNKILQNKKNLYYYYNTMSKPESNKYDINYRIKQAFSIYYQKNDKCSRPIILNEILEDLNKVKYDRTVDNLDMLVKSLFDAKFKFLTKNNRSCSFVRIKDDVPKTRLDVFFYKKRNDVDNPNSDINIHSISKYLLFHNQGKKISISIPILNFDIDLSNKQVSEFINSHTECSAFLKKIKSKKLANIISFQLSEHFFSMSLLQNSINDINEIQLKTIIFQMTSLLSYLQHKYSDLRLNQKIEDVSVYIKKPSERVFHYFINGIHYGIPDSGFQIKVNNFINTHIVDELKNDSLATSKKKKRSVCRSS